MKERIKEDIFDLYELLHPADAFEHPLEVLNDTDLTIGEKRAILASWASDACAYDAAPYLRGLSRGRLISFDTVLDALRALDRDVTETSRKYKKLKRQRSLSDRSHRSDSVGRC